jgi:UDP-N-acetylglucosamine 3-dehydrogenase
LKKLKVGVIGLGGISRSGHLPAYKQISEIEVVAAAEIRKDVLDQVCLQYGIQQKYTDYEEMLRKEDLDIISILTPPFYHKTMCERAAEVGVNILCEKPLATSFKDGKAILDACERNRINFMYSENYRFMPTCERAQQYVHRGETGKIILITERRHGGSVESLVRRKNDRTLGWRQKKEMAGGGVLLDHGVHAIDLCRWFACSEIENVYAKIRSFSGIEVEDFAQMMINFRSGSEAYIENSWICRYGGFADLEFTIYGEEATLQIYPRINSMHVFTKDKWNRIRLQNVDKTSYMQVYSTKKLMESYARSLLKDEPPQIPATEALKDLEAILLAYKSAIEGTTQKVS